MLEKEVKQYKRGNSFTYRIDLSKKDNFEGGEKIMIFRMSEYEAYLNEIEDLKSQIEENNKTISELRESRSEANSNINNVVDNHNKEIADKNKEIMDLIEENKSAIQKCYDIIEEKDKLLTQANEEIRIEREKTDATRKQAQEDILNERKRHDELTLEKDKQLKLVNEQLQDSLKDIAYKDKVITADRLLIERYKNRGFVDRLLNRLPDDSDLKIDDVKETYVLEAEKKE
ncbi:hypothetical protein mru_2149 [Methanobrevibacter ruminantium M1]|uniref:Uncharacterized protein n=1 Tax=Methanobrevibacter ruminantium (strain ATCC 35063 / DSM 1093 / JCM 13430 / OCM 146 / M1) TaxID=634498 RepID=D3E1B4_METRM|nr:hypothetical protein [Methanobrevibacter ruminantium]ADC47999.1 hypothetical protein mru_2149 [Methanobrevibacter ruminantium M1]